MAVRVAVVVRVGTKVGVVVVVREIVAARVAVAVCGVVDAVSVVSDVFESECVREREHVDVWLWVWDDVGIEGEEEGVDDGGCVLLDVAVGGSERVAEVFSV